VAESAFGVKDDASPAYALDPNLLIGTGGWHYFLTPGDKLANYSRCFRFVEVNASFYSHVPLRMAFSWRRRVPEGFVFSVKAHRAITHKHKFRICEETIKAQGHLRRFCEALGAEAIVYSTPPSFEPTDANLGAAREFFTEADRGALKLFWEVRGRAWWTAEARAALRKALAESDVTHSADLSYQEPVHAKQLVYSRVFGPMRERTRRGQYRVSDSQLERVGDQIGKHLGGKKKVMVAFHTVRMYEDAARMIKRA
jgi:uncharacterized protein YecE (DUF72 family)